MCFFGTQEQVEQSIREKTELQKELDQIKEENETLKRALQTEQQEAASLKVCSSNILLQLRDNEHVCSLPN